jgi:CheY-like chemotaxis protein
VVVISQQDPVPSLLVVDDSETARTLIAWSLGGLPATYTVVEAESGERALELLAERTFTAMVADHHMPGISGLELVCLVREQPEHANMPIVVITADEDPTIAEKAAELGVFTTVRKPFEPHALGAAIEAAMAERPGTPSRIPAPGPNLQGFLDSMPYVAMVLDGNHSVLVANETFYTVTGVGIDDSGLDCALAVHGEMGIPDICPLEESKRTGKPAECVFTDPALGPLRVNVYPLDRYSPDGARLYLHLMEPLGEAER